MTSMATKRKPSKKYGGRATSTLGSSPRSSGALSKMPGEWEPLKSSENRVSLTRGDVAVGRASPGGRTAAVVLRSAGDVVTESIHAILQQFHSNLTTALSTRPGVRPVASGDGELAARPDGRAVDAAAQKILVAARKAAKIEQMRAYARQGALTASERFKSTNGISPI